MNTIEPDINLYRKLVADITPTEFEIVCRDTLKAYAEKEALQDFLIIHDKKIEADDGIFQIDIYCEFNALGAKFKVIVECKRYRRPVEREKVIALHAKVSSIGANKGILISTSGFQTGATQYAEKHGITLIQIAEASIQYISNAVIRPERRQIQIQAEMRRRLPDYISVIWDGKDDYPYETVYPSEAMIKSAKKEIIDLLKKEEH